MTGYDDDDEDSEGLDDLETVPAEGKPYIPLHLKEAVILKKPEEKVVQVVKEIPSSQPVIKPKAPVVREPAPYLGAFCGLLWGRVQLCCTVTWAILVSLLLIMHVLIFQGELGNRTHRLIADSALQHLEVSASGLLSPALSVMRVVALGSKSGIFEAGDPYLALQTAVAPEMALAPGVRHVQVLGLDGERLVQMFPGKLSDTSVAKRARKPVFHSRPTTACYRPADPMACFGLNTSEIELFQAQYDGADVAWTGPSYLRFGRHGEDQFLYPALWDLAHHLVAFVNMTDAGGAKPHMYVDVAIELASVAEAAREAAPFNGGMVIASAAGWTLASSVPLADAALDAAADETQPRRFYGVTDLDMPWVNVLTPAVMQAQSRTEMWIGRDLVVVRPLKLGSRGGGYSLASQNSLRIAVFVPREEAVRPLLVQISYGAVGIMGTPFAMTVLVVIAAFLAKWLRILRKKLC